MFMEMLQAVTGVFVLVYDGQHGLGFTLGRARRVVGPGVHFKWPIIQNYRVEETKHTTLDLEPQTIQLVDDLVYEVDCKVVYQIVDLHKALIQIDDLVTGLQNRVVMAVQKVLRARDRESIRDTEALSMGIREELRPVGEEWGVRILHFGFSNISPSPATLEITQLELLAREKLRLYEMYRQRGLSDEAAVGLISGAVVALDPQGGSGGSTLYETRLADARADDIENAAEAQRQAEEKRRQETKEQKLFSSDDPDDRKDQDGQ